MSKTNISKHIFDQERPSNKDIIKSIAVNKYGMRTPWLLEIIN